MNVIFLDMDGVCNNASYLKWYKARYRKTPHFSFEYTVPYLVERVSRICAECNAFIVWSSSWRELYTMAAAKNLFERVGLPHERLLGFTPSLNSYPTANGNVPRGREIRFFCFNNLLDEPITEAAVLDDDSDAGIELPDYCKFFQTTWEDGLTEKITENVIKYFNK